MALSTCQTSIIYIKLWDKYKYNSLKNSSLSMELSIISKIYYNVTLFIHLLPTTIPILYNHQIPISYNHQKV
jgi:hypothetical protein